MIVPSKEDIRLALEADFVKFCKVMGPERLYGQCHEDVMRWMTRPDAKNNQLVLLPRAHQKSHIIAMWVVWIITKDPTLTVLYASATERLALAQLYAIKQVLESPQYRRYWPEMIHEVEGKRAKWSASDIIVDHPLRAKMKIRDSTVAAVSIGSNTTGLHCDVVVFDDIVVPANAYTELGRSEVDAAYAQFSSVLNPGGITKAVGTRYHPNDIYDKMKGETVPTFNDDGDEIGSEELWEIYEAVVEVDGRFLWPREFNPPTGRWEGFNPKILAGIKAKYGSNPAHFYAQYYNDPNDPTSNRVDRDKFIYYEERHLKVTNGEWSYNGRKLAVYAAVDVAWTTNLVSDYTAIAVIGVDYEGKIYVLEVDRFKTSDFLEYYNRFIALHRKWGFRKLMIETNAAGKLVEQEVKKFVRMNGDHITIEGRNKTSHDMKKAERWAITLEPRYNNGDVLHYRGGLITALEEELMLERSKHDDLKDALCTAVEISVPPSKRASTLRDNVVSLRSHNRFGGVMRR